MASSNYSAWSVVAGEQPTTAKWNILGTNDAAFNTGQGFNDGIIINRHVAPTAFSSAISSFANTGTGGGTIYYVSIGGLKIMWGIGMVSNAAAWNGINYAPVGYSSPPILTGNGISQGSATSGWVEFTSLATGGSGSPSNTGCTFLCRVSTVTNSNAVTVNFMGIGT